MTGSCAIHSVMTQTCISGRTENEIMIETLQYYAILVYTCLRQSAEYIYIYYICIIIANIAFHQFDVAAPGRIPRRTKPPVVIAIRRIVEQGR